MSIESERSELIQRSVDGATTPEEEARLRGLLAGSEAARSEYEQLRRIANALDESANSEPPPAIKANILREIESRVAARTEAVGPRPGFLAAIAGRLRAASWPKPAYALAGGIAFGMVAFAMMVSRSGLEVASESTSTAPLSATILPVPHDASFEAVDRARFSLQGVRATAETKSSGRLLLADLEIESRGEVTVSVAFGDEALRLIGLERQRPQAAQITESAGGVRFKHEGNDRYRLCFEPATDAINETATEIDIRIETNGVSQVRTLAARFSART